MHERCGPKGPSLGGAALAVMSPAASSLLNGRRCVLCAGVRRPRTDCSYLTTCQSWLRLRTHMLNLTLNPHFLWLYFL